MSRCKVKLAYTLYVISQLITFIFVLGSHFLVGGIPAIIIQLYQHQTEYIVLLEFNSTRDYLGYTCSVQWSSGYNQLCLCARD